MLAGSVTSSRVSDTPSYNRRPALGVALAGALAAADDHDFAQRRLLLVLELGPVAVVAPRAKRRGEPDARRRIGVEAEAADVDHGLLLARGQQPRDRGSAELLGGILGGRRRCRCRRRAGAAASRRHRRTVPTALDASPSNRWRSSARRPRLLRGPERSQARPVLARDRQHRAHNLPSGRRVGEANFM